MVPFIFLLPPVIAQMSSAQSPAPSITPEVACGPSYHEFSLDAMYTHAPRETSIEQILAAPVLLEGTVLSKRAYLGPGVVNEVKVQVTKLLSGSKSAVGEAITVQVDGGYAGDADGKTCRQNTIADGARIKVGSSYVIVAEKTPSGYRALPMGGWFRIEKSGELVPVTPHLAKSGGLSGKKVADLEAAASSKEERR